MSVQPSFKAAINVLAELASDNHPAYVRLAAASKLAKFLSPANPRYGDVLYDLKGDDGRPPTPALRAPEPPTENPCAEFLIDQEDDEEDDESERAAQEDEPP